MRRSNEGSGGEVEDLRPAIGPVGSRMSRTVAGFLRDGLNLPLPVLLASVISSLLGLALPLAMLQVYDRVLPNEATETLALLIAGLVVVFLLDAAFRILRGYLLGWYAMRETCRTHLKAVDRLLGASHEAIEKRPAAMWTDSFDALRQLGVFDSGQTRLLALDIPLAGIFLVMIGLVGGPLVLVPIVLIALTIAFGVHRARRLERALTRSSVQDNRKHDFLVECFSGIRTVKGLAMEPMMMRRFERLHAGTARATHDTILVGNQLQATGILFANLMMVAVVSAGALLVMNGRLSIGGLACCALLAGRLTQPALRGVGLLTEVQNVRLARDRAARFWTLPPHPKASELGGYSGAITIANCSVCHAGRERPVLKDVSLVIAAGDFVGITGEEGSGRTTFLRLIGGKDFPDSGRVVHSPANEREAGRGVAYVSDRSAIFRGSIMQNITMFRGGAAEEAARAAARLIGLEADVHRLPRGFETQIGHGAAHTLPPSLMQRILIARAIALRPAILLLDEASVLLDSDAETALMRGLLTMKGRVTIVLVSDRPSVLRLADRVFRLEAGRLVPLVADALSAPVPRAAE